MITNPNPKSHTPFILSKAAVEKIRVKFGQVQARANSGALILTKSFKCNNNNNSNKSGNNSRPNATVAPVPTPTPTAKPKSVPTTPMPVPMPAPMPMPMPMPATKPNAIMPEIKISPLPAAVNLNGAKILKVPGGALAVVVPAVATPPAVPAVPSLPAAAATLATVTSNCGEQGSGIKLQRSKSLAGNAEDPDVVCIQSNSPERRHSVAIMSKEVDVIETPTAIETITIDDDDSEEEKEPEPVSVPVPVPMPVQQQKPVQSPPTQLQQVPAQTTPPPPREQTPSAQNSRKNSTTSRSSFTSSSSDLEIITPPTLNVENVQQQQAPQKPEQLEAKEQPSSAKLSILKAESLSKEEFEKSLRCTESALQSSPSAVSTSSSSTSTKSTGTITLTPISRLQKNGVELNVVNNFKRNMQQNFSMLRWRDQQPGTLPSSKMRFELNRFSLLQLTERCEPRHGPASYFERALFDRPARRPNSSSHPLLYLCMRCNCHGPASDFLAPRE